jgi:hypothetical protein
MGGNLYSKSPAMGGSSPMVVEVAPIEMPKELGAASDSRVGCTPSRPLTLCVG